MKILVFTILALSVCSAIKSNKNWSVSGFDSGGFMATQMGFAFSSTIKGVGSFGASFYFCAEEDENNVNKQCINNKFKDIEHVTTQV